MEVGRESASLEISESTKPASESKSLPLADTVKADVAVGCDAGPKIGNVMLSAEPEIQGDELTDTPDTLAVI